MKYCVMMAGVDLDQTIEADSAEIRDGALCFFKHWGACIYAAGSWRGFLCLDKDAGQCPIAMKAQ